MRAKPAGALAEAWFGQGHAFKTKSGDARGLMPG